MGHMMVGPKLYPARPRGAQIIQRGPHGYRFSADPIAERRAGRRGSGFVWWSEQIARAGGNETFWLPRQRVVGVMGLGGVQAPSIAPLMECPPGAPPLPTFPPEGTPGTRAVRIELIRAVGAACRGRIPGARKAIEGSRYFLNSVRDSASRSVWSDQIAKAEDYIRLAEKGALRRNLVQQQRERAYGTLLRKHEEELARAMPMNNGTRCAPYDIACQVGQFQFPWVKAGLTVAGLAFAYGLARGVGQSIF